MQEQNTSVIKRSKRRILAPETIIISLLFLAGLALRWDRLDLVSFRYDTAEALLRARETVHSGLPLTGIVNSLGFRNPAGLIYLILPPLLVSPSPALVTGWFSLLTLTGLYPLFAICRRCFSRWAFLLPCCCYALLPNQVFAARSIWAQWIMPPIAAWSLYFLVLLLTQTNSSRRRNIYAAASLALSWLATAVHLGGAVYTILLIAAIVSIAVKNKWSGQQLLTGLAIGSIPMLLLLPSGFDWIASRTGPPRPKPPHIAKFEALMPPPESVASRLHDAVGGQFQMFSNAGQADGVPDHISPQHANSRHASVRIIDSAIWIQALLGFVYAAFIAIRGRLRPNANTPIQLQHAQLTLARLCAFIVVVPAVLGAIFIPRINATYFATGTPAILLLLGFAYEFLYVGRATIIGVSVCTAAAAGIYCWLPISLLNDIDRSGFVDSQYYIPLRDQLVTTQQLTTAGVSTHRLTHLSGDWFQRPYEYLLQEVCKSPELTEKPHWAVLEDSNLRRNQQARVQFFAPHAILRHNTVGIALFEDPYKANQFANAYYNIPVEDETTSVTLK